ncbi:MAG TPA: lactate utilization protein C [Burkholderiales bacterium]|nr:lactate utilization protein C [Burkholderiales bacterium]
MTVGNSDAARKDILARIRAAQGRGASSRPSQAEIDAVKTYIEAHPRGPLPDVEDDVVARFRARAEAMQSTTEAVERLADVPAAAARYLAANGLPGTGCVWPALGGLDWAGAGLALEARGAEDRDLVGVTGVFAALAETGTLMVASGPQTPAGVSLLPETHIAVVPVTRIVKHMEDGWALARAELGELPRLVNFISGPSRTGDIDQTIVLGAHGPYRVHMILVRATD